MHDRLFFFKTYFYYTFFSVSEFGMTVVPGNGTENVRFKHGITRSVPLCCKFKLLKIIRIS
jgi:hypothetical protein